MNRIITTVLSLTIFSLFLAGFLHPITAYTQDLGRHLLMGKIMLNTQSVPDTNLLSYTYPDFPFINHHYLSGILYYLLQQSIGDTGLLLFSIFLVSIACGGIFLFSLKKAHIIPTSFLAIIYLHILFERTDIRPEQFGYLLFSVFLIILYNFRESKLNVIASEVQTKRGNLRWKKIASFLAMTGKSTPSKLIFILIPLSLLWIQLHISFVYGLFLIGLFFLDSLCADYKQKEFTKSKILLITLIGSGLITIFNPNGLAGTLYPLHIFQNYGYTIQENQTIFLLDEIAPTPSIFYFKIAVLLLFTSLLIRIKHTRPIDWLLALSFTYLAGSAIRNFPFFTLATFIPASLYFSESYNLLLNSIMKTKLTPKIPVLVTCLLLLVTYFQIKTVTAQKPIGLSVAKGAERGADFFIKNNLSGPIFNNFDIGSYVAYRLYPQEKVFIDGRPEAYPSEFIQKTYIPMQQDPSVFEKVDKHYGFNTIFFSHTDQTPWANEFLKTILQNSAWQTVYLDETSLILLKKNATNDAVIEKFGMKVDKLRGTNIDENDFQSLLKLASFFNKTGLIEQEVPIDEKLLQINPTFCPAIYSLATYYNQKQNSFQSQIYQQQFLLYCN